MTRIAAIVACYNGRQWIDGCIESILAQTRPPERIVVTDDGSTDGSSEALDAWSARVEALTVVHQPNAGLSAARNAAIRAAGDADVLAVLDVDDRWHAGKLETHAAFLDAHGEVDLGFSDFRVVDEQGEVLAGSGLSAHPLMWNHRWEATEGGEHVSRDDSLEWTVRDSFVHPSTMMIRREAFERAGPFAEWIRNGEDIDFTIRLLKIGGRLGFVPRAMTDVTETASSLCRGNLNSWRWRVRLMGEFGRMYADRLSDAERVALREVAAGYDLMLAYHLADAGEHAEARARSWSAWRNGRGWPALRCWLGNVPLLRRLAGRGRCSRPGRASDRPDASNRMPPANE